jgi:hypothetical protein
MAKTVLEGFSLVIGRDVYSTTLPIPSCNRHVMVHAFLLSHFFLDIFLLNVLMYACGLVRG